MARPGVFILLPQAISRILTFNLKYHVLRDYRFMNWLCDARFYMFHPIGAEAFSGFLSAMGYEPTSTNFGTWAYTWLS